MRKYLLLVLFILSSLSFLFVNVSQSQAVSKEGEDCDEVDVTGYYLCQEGLYCKSRGGGLFTWHYGTCQKKEQVTCSCANPGTADPDGKGLNQINCPGSPPIYCSSNQTCNKAADSNTPANGNIDFKKQEDAFNQKTITGVFCADPKKIAECTCDPNDKHKFNCTIDGKQNAGSGSCKADGDECGAASDPKASTDFTTTDTYEGALGPGFDIRGITCSPPKAQCTCEQPGVAEPGSNGFNCTLNGQTAHDFCEHENVACVTASGSAMVGGGGSKSKPFNGATLEGIKCSVPGSELSPAPTEPPPPSPPCKVWSGNGQCGTFGSAFGDLLTDPSGFVKTLFAILLSFSGGIALLLIIRAGYRLLISQGKPEQINQARDELVAAIVGLVFLIFAFVVLQTIGVDILHLPGWGA